MKTIDMIYAVHDDSQIVITSMDDGTLYEGLAKDLDFETFKKIVNQYSTVEYIRSKKCTVADDGSILIKVRKDKYAE